MGGCMGGGVGGGERKRLGESGPDSYTTLAGTSNYPWYFECLSCTVRRPVQKGQHHH